MSVINPKQTFKFLCQQSLILENILATSSLYRIKYQTLFSPTFGINHSSIQDDQFHEKIQS